MDFDVRLWKWLIAPINFVSHNDFNSDYLESLFEHDNDVFVNIIKIVYFHLLIQTAHTSNEVENIANSD